MGVTLYFSYTLTNAHIYINVSVLNISLQSPFFYSQITFHPAQTIKHNSNSCVCCFPTYGNKLRKWEIPPRLWIFTPAVS